MIDINDYIWHTPYPKEHNYTPKHPGDRHYNEGWRFVRKSRLEELHAYMLMLAHTTDHITVESDGDFKLQPESFWFFLVSKNYAGQINLEYWNMIVERLNED